MFAKVPSPVLHGLAWALALAPLLAPSSVEARKLVSPRACTIEIDDIVFGPPDPGTPGPFGIVQDQYGVSTAEQN